MILVFIEIIQLNFCGLSYMTKKNIEERARIDSMFNEDNDDEDSNNNILNEILYPHKIETFWKFKNNYE